MRKVLLAAVLVMVGCAGGRDPDPVSFEVRDGQPWCSAGSTQHPGTIPNTGTPYVMCWWKCGAYENQPATAVFVKFTNETLGWTVHPAFSDPTSAECE